MTLAEIKDKKLTCVVHTKSKNEAKLLEGCMPWEGYWGDNPSDRWCVYSEQTAYYIEDGILMQFSPVSFYKDKYPTYGEVYEFSDLFATFRVSPNEADELIKKEFNVKWIEEEKKMPTKFTFYTEEGYRIDKSNNSKVETITTFVKINGFDNTYLGMATCDKADYSEREGVINALANAMCNGNFDREFNKAVKANELADKKKRTCTYCGKVFDTVEEKQAEEAWHVERRKARHERYLLRKRAKEIAFEEQAQKMAKEMMGEQK